MIITTNFCARQCSFAVKNSKILEAERWSTAPAALQFRKARLLCVNILCKKPRHWHRPSLGLII